jgi:hypothetical protein
MTAGTFDGSTVPSFQISRIDSRGVYHFEVVIGCRTETYADYTTLSAKAGQTINAGACANATKTYEGYTSVQSKGGTCGTLVLNGVTYTNCYIQSLSAAEVSQSNLGVWEFTISFVKDTTL